MQVYFISIRYSSIIRCQASLDTYSILVITSNLTLTITVFEKSIISDHKANIHSLGISRQDRSVSAKPS